MTSRLPPLNALRAFEAAARHLSFTRAAGELSVTPAAISHQIRQLEEILGTPLFRRLTRGLLLTDAGQLLLPGVRDGFDRIADAVAQLAMQPDTRIVVVGTTPSFAAKWLVPRLERFAAAHPDLDVQLSASLELADFRRGRFDCAVRFGFGPYPGLNAVKLFDESVIPLCSPALMAGRHPLTGPDDLGHHTLLHDESGAAAPALGDWEVTWPMWLKAAGVEGVDVRRGLRFSHAEHALQAAIDGAGVVLSRRSLAATDIAAGRLVAPFRLSLPITPAFRLVWPANAPGRPAAAAFRNWLLSEAGVASQVSP